MNTNCFFPPPLPLAVCSHTLQRPAFTQVRTPGRAVQCNTTAPDLQQHLHVDVEERQQPEQVFFRSAVTVGEERRTKNCLCTQKKYKIILYIKEKYYKTTF